jgi:hypothetical protein
MGADLPEERSIHKIEKDNPALAGRVLFRKTTGVNNTSNNLTDVTTAINHPVTLWKIVRIVRSGGRMYI